MRLVPDTPILTDLIVELGQDRDAASKRADELGRRMADLEALHEPNSDGDCPTCLAPAPCLTHLLVRGEISLDQAYSVVRDHQPLDLVGAESDDSVNRRPVPSLQQLLAAPMPSLDRFFDALLRAPVASRD